MTKTLTRLMDPVLDALGINFQNLIVWRISMKAMEHKSGWGVPCARTRLCFVWWLCARCTTLDFSDLGRISEVKFKC